MEQTKCLARRWVALWIDLILLALFLSTANYVLGKELYRELPALWVAVVFLYYPVLEGFYGASIGKFLTGIRVLDVGGNNAGFYRCFLRTIPRILETNPIVAGGAPAGIVCLLTENNQRLGDIIAGTIVVRAEDVRSLQRREEDDLA